MPSQSLAVSVLPPNINEDACPAKARKAKCMGFLGLGLAQLDPTGEGRRHLIDEDPSSEDLDRFGSETATCPSCDQEVWDEAPQCPSCGCWLAGEGLHRQSARRRLIVVLIVLVTLAAFLVAVIL